MQTFESHRGVSPGLAFPVMTPLKEDGDKRVFEKTFVNFIGELSAKHHSVYWWASGLSEKNEFISKLFERIYRLHCLSLTLRNLDGKPVVVVCPDEVLRRQVIKNYRNLYKIKIRSLTDRFLFLKRGCIYFLSFFKHIFLLFKECVQSLLSRWVLRGQSRIFAGPEPFIVFRSWARPDYFRNKQYGDPYFHDLPDYSAREGNAVFFVVSILSGFYQTLKCLSDNVGPRMFPTCYFLRPGDFFALFFDYFRKVYMPPRELFEGVDVSECLRDELLASSTSGQFFYAMIQYYACRGLARAARVERFIYPYENYAWEKLSILGLRSVKKKIRIVGFQHAFVSRNSFKYFPGEAESGAHPFPDRIVSLGRRTIEIMKGYGAYPDGIFVPGCAIRQRYICETKPLERDQAGDIFVPLTITVEDSVKLLNFLIHAKLADYQGKVNLRFHPMTPVREVLAGLDSGLPDNFIISDAPNVTAELARCSVVLYTWTTVCLEALKMGRPAIYLDVNYPCEVDPLFECDALKDTCSRPDMLLEKIHFWKTCDDARYTQDARRARDYLTDYFSAVTEQGMDAFLKC